MIRISAYGRLGGDPVARTTKTGKSMITGTLAVSVGRSGEPEATEWFGLTSFGQAGEELGRHSKGDPIAVMGPLHRSSFVGRDGKERASWTITIETVVSARTVRPGARKPSARSDSRRRELAGTATLPDDPIEDIGRDDPFGFGDPR
jgi:single-strand DNA-binding protein